MARIIYTHTDEAPLLATYSFLPIIQAYAGHGRACAVETRDISLAGPDHRPVPRAPAARSSASATRSPSSASWPRRPRPTSSSCRTSRASIPQLKAAIAELQAQGYDLPDYPDEPEDRRGADVRARYDKVKGSRRQPGAARGQLRPPRARVGQGVRPEAPALDGRLVARLEDQRRHMTAGRLPLQREVGRHRAPTTRCASSTSPPTARPPCCKESVPVLAGEVVDATVMRVAALREFLDRADRAGQGRGRAVLGAPQGHDDEGLRPDHLRPRRAGLLPDALRAVRRRARRRRHQPQRRPRRAPRRGSTALPEGDAIEAAVDAGLADGPALAMVDSDKGITNLHVPSRRHRRRLDAGDDPHLRPHVGPRRRGGRHPRGDPRQLLRRHLPGRHRRLPRPRRLRPGHHGLGAQRRADGAGGRGVRLPRQDLRDPGGRHGARRRRRRRRAASSTTCQRRRHLARLPDQGRRRSATGSSSPSPAPAPPAPRRCSGSTRPAPTTPT